MQSVQAHSLTRTYIRNASSNTNTSENSHCVGGLARVPTALDFRGCYVVSCPKIIKRTYFTCPSNANPALHEHPHTDCVGIKYIWLQQQCGGPRLNSAPSSINDPTQTETCLPLCLNVFKYKDVKVTDLPDYAAYVRAVCVCVYGKMLQPHNRCFSMHSITRSVQEKVKIVAWNTALQRKGTHVWLWLWQDLLAGLVHHTVLCLFHRLQWCVLV